MRAGTAPSIFADIGRPVGINDRVLPVGPTADYTHDYQVVQVILGGSALHCSPSLTSRVTRGSIILVRPGTRHRFEVSEPLDIVVLFFDPLLLYRDFAWVLSGPLAPQLLAIDDCVGHADDERVERIARLIRRLTEWTTGRPAEVAVAVTAVVLSELADLEFSPATERHAAFSSLVREGMLLLADHPTHPWTTAELARLLRSSESTVFRRFQAETGTSALGWLARFRVDAASRLLSETDRPIGVIGQDVGWPDPTHFSRRFRDITGLRPSEHRRRHRTARTPPRTGGT